VANVAEILLTLGCLLLLGIAVDVLGKRTFLPRVTLLMILGILVGPEVLDFIPVVVVSQFDVITTMTLTMLGFILGGRLAESIGSMGRPLFFISLTAAIGTSFIVMTGLFIFGVPLALAVLLGCISSATDPAAIVDCVDEGSFKGRFAVLLTAIVALDDAWALILFSIGLSVAQVMSDPQGFMQPIIHAVYDIGGAVVLGVVLGIPAAFVTGRAREGKPLLTEMVGVTFFCGGAAIYLGVSFLIAAMAMGGTIARLAAHHEKAIHEIENMETPFLIVFFVLAGASLEMEGLRMIGVIGSVYIVCRTLGKVIGAWTGAVMSSADRVTRTWMGWALLPQAGAASGMALVAASQFPEYRQVLLSVVISSTILFELIGPIFTRQALQRGDVSTNVV